MDNDQLHESLQDTHGPRHSSHKQQLQPNQARREEDRGSPASTTVVSSWATHVVTSQESMQGTALSVTDEAHFTLTARPRTSQSTSSPQRIKHRYNHEQVAESAAGLDSGLVNETVWHNDDPNGHQVTDQDSTLLWSGRRDQLGGMAQLLTSDTARGDRGVWDGRARKPSPTLDEQHRAATTLQAAWCVPLCV